MKNSIQRPIVIFIISLGVFFPSQLFAKVVINEIGAFEKTDSEWIEIFNTGPDARDITGWKFYEDATNHSLKTFQGDFVIDAGEYAIIAQNAEILFQEKNFSGTIYDSSWGTLKESGEEVGLKDADGIFVEQFIYIPAQNFSLEKINPALLDYTEKNWKEHPQSHSAGNKNTASSENPQLLPSEQTNIQGPSRAPSTAFSGDIVINEIVSDPSDGEDEWVELFNKTASLIDLSGWTLEEGSERKTNISGTVLARGFFIIEKPSGNLNNSGDIIILKNPSGQIIDEVSYGLWQDGDASDNAPSPQDPESLARISDGYDTNNDFSDFKITQTKTRGSANLISEKTPAPKLVYSKNLIISELYPNPKEDEEEFIEIINIGSDPINISGWKIQDATERPYIFSEIILEPQMSFAVSRKESNIALNNIGRETVTLLSPDGTEVSSVSYSGKAPKGKSYSRDELGKWLWSLVITQGKENIIEKENEPPRAVISGPDSAKPGEIISFDASDSYDTDKDEIFFLWNFGDGRSDTRQSPMQIYANAGTYKISLKVTDSKNNSSDASHIITIQDNASIEKTSVSLIQNYARAQKIFLSEVLPNPKGNDAELEFIEIYNGEGTSVNLEGWILDDDEGASKPYKLDGLILEPNEYLAIFQTQSNISLNNNFDSVRLFDETRNLADSMFYDMTLEDVSYIKNEYGLWEMTRTPTPGEINVLVNLKNQEVSSAEGVVTALPGVLGSQIMYIMDENSGMQIYSFKKSWPKLELGDRVSVRGTNSVSRGEQRIKISEADDITVLGHGTAPLPLKTKISEAENQESGVLVALEGEVTERKGNNFYIDDGTGEMYVYIKDATGIREVPNLKDFVSVAGIFVENSNGIRLLPRSQDDIVITKTLGTSLESAEEKIEPPKPQKFNGYLMGTVILLGVMNAHLFWTVYKKH